MDNAAQPGVVIRNALLYDRRPASIALLTRVGYCPEYPFARSKDLLMPSRADALQRLPLFAGLPRADRELIARYMDELQFPPGSTLINEGQSNHTFFVLADGEADVSISGKPRRTLRSGDFFGEISMQHRILATATIVARTAVTVYVMSHQQFGALGSSPDVVARLQAAIGDRLANDRMVSREHA